MVDKPLITMNIDNNLPEYYLDDIESYESSDEMSNDSDEDEESISESSEDIDTDNDDDDDDDNIYVFSDKDDDNQNEDDIISFNSFIRSLKK